MDEAVSAGLRAAGFCARSCALAAMEAAAAVGHRRLTAGAAAPRLGTAAGRGQEIAAGVAVLQAAAPEEALAFTGASAFALRATADEFGGFTRRSGTRGD